MCYGVTWRTFKSIVDKKTNLTPKFFYIFLEMELSSSKIKKFLIFHEIEFSGPKLKKLYFLNKSFSYILENRTFLKKTSYISGRNFLSSKNKKNQLRKNFLYFGKWNFLTPRLKKFLYFSKCFLLT